MSTALAAALLLVVGGPADLIGEEYQLQAAKKRRASQLHSWLAVQEGAVGATDVLARSILQEAEKHSLDPVLVLAVIQIESRFDRKAVSTRGAQGLMQLRRVVVDELVGGGKIPARRHDLKDPQVNVEIGVSYLAHLVEMFGDLNIALAAYNWGPTQDPGEARRQPNHSVAIREQSSARATFVGNRVGGDRCRRRGGRRLARAPEILVLVSSQNP